MPSACRAVANGHAFRAAAALLASLAIPGLLAAQELTTDNPYKVKAAFLRNFMRYVTWPSQAMPGGQAPWRVGVLGRDPFGPVLEATFQGRVEQGHGFQVVRAEALDKLPPCQVVYIAYADPEARRAALRQLRRLPVLTVGDAPGFLQEGGTIRFTVSDHVEMAINLDQARASALGISAKMLEVTREVLENGEMRKVR